MDNIYSVMKRIHEIRGRFGLRTHRNVQRNASGQNSVSYQDYQARALERNHSAQDAGSADSRSGNKRSTVEDIKRIADYHAAANKVPPGLVKAVIEAESGYNPHAVSPKGAKGLMQLMPATIKNLGVIDPYDPNENISAGVGLLRTLLQNYNWDYKKALAAYNAGEKAVDRKGNVPDYNETREFVKKVINAYVRNNE
jgi:soluble lytic murein transglycosylase-like protein